MRTRLVSWFGYQTDTIRVDTRRAQKRKFKIENADSTFEEFKGLEKFRKARNAKLSLTVESHTKLTNFILKNKSENFKRVECYWASGSQVGCVWTVRWEAKKWAKDHRELDFYSTELQQATRTKSFVLAGQTEGLRMVNGEVSRAVAEGGQIGRAENKFWAPGTQ